MGQENRKGKKIILISILFLMIILVATYIAYCYYTQNIATQALKNEVLTNLKNNDIAFFLNQEFYQTIQDRMKKNDYESISDITLSTTMENNMFSELDLSKFQFHYDFIKNDQKNYHKLQTQYAGNHFITLDCITTSKQFALKSDEIVNKYVGIHKENFQNTINQLYQTEVDLTDFKKAKNFLIDRQMIDFSKLQNNTFVNTIGNLAEKEILGENISKKENVVVTLNSEQHSTTEYTISFNQNQVNNLINRNFPSNRERRIGF